VWRTKNDDSWESEYLQHLYWGNRIFDQIDDSDRLLKAIEARLLVPFPRNR
jgi:hypothetical protein